MLTLSMRKHPRLPLMRELSAKLTEGEHIVSSRFLPLKAHRIVSQKIIPDFSFPRGYIFSQHLGQRGILFVAGFHVLSLRQKSKIFATSLIRGRLWCGAKPQIVQHTDRCIEVRPLFVRQIQLMFVKPLFAETPSKKGCRK